MTIDWLLVLAGFAMGGASIGLLIQLRSRRQTAPTPIDTPDVDTAVASGPVQVALPPTEWSWAVNPLGQFTAASSSSLPVIGYHPSELIGRDVAMIMDPRELGRAEAMVNSLGVTDSGLSDLVVSGLHRDGTSSWFELTLSTVTDAAGNVVSYEGRSRAIGAEAALVVAAQHAGHGSKPSSPTSCC